MLRHLFPALLMMVLSVSVLAADPQVIEVKLDSYSITPDKIVVKIGQPVTLKVTNVATFIPHDLVIKAPDAGVDLKIDLRAGKSGEVSFTPTRTGSYEMFCDKEPPIGKSHRAKGMHGTLIVE
jgi:plastocyanin